MGKNTSAPLLQIFVFLFGPCFVLIPEISFAYTRDTQTNTWTEVQANLEQVIKLRKE